MAMIDVAKFGRSHKPVSLSDIAARQELSLNYLEQLFCRLRRAGLVQSTRGALGGYLLAKSAAAVSVADIVQAADEPVKLTRCNIHDGKGCMADASRCLSHHLWDSLGSQILSYLTSISLQDVLDKNFPTVAFPEADQFSHLREAL